MTNSEDPIPLMVKLCADKAAFDARIQRRVLFDMKKVKQEAEDCRDLEIVVYTPHLIILKFETAEITLSKDGRMLIKKVANESEAKQIAQKILRTVHRASF